MITKSSEVLKLIKLLRSIFGSESFVVCDKLDSSNAIRFQKNEKMVYVACHNEDDYFFEWEIINGKAENSYVALGSDSANQKQLIEIIGTFLGLSRNTEKVEQEL